MAEPHDPPVRFAPPTQRAVPAQLDTAGYMAHCGCPFCRGVRLIVYGCGDTLPRGTPLGSYSPASAGGYNPDALPSTDAYGNSGRANEALANRDYAGYIAAQDLAYGLAYPLSGNPWSRF